MIPCLITLFIWYRYQTTDLFRLFASHLEVRFWPWSVRQYLKYNQIQKIELDGTFGKIPFLKGTSRFANVAKIHFVYHGQPGTLTIRSVIIGKKQFVCLMDALRVVTGEKEETSEDRLGTFNQSGLRP